MTFTSMKSYGLADLCQMGLIGNPNVGSKWETSSIIIPDHGTCGLHLQYYLKSELSHTE